MSDNKDDDWDFKVDRGVTPHDAKSDIKSRLGKKQSLEDIAAAFSDEPEAPSELVLDHEATVPRRERLENFKKSHALERYAAIKPAPLGRRIKSLMIDVIFQIALIGAGVIVFPFTKQFLERNLPSGVLSEVPHPEIVLQSILPVLLLLFFHIIPTCSSRKSLGKKILSIRIGSKFEDGKVSKKCIFIREVIIKPLSLLSVVGILIIFVNSKRRALHDYICGTAVYDEL
ncbi:MAG: hypothetical protein COW01_11845 [Bdellovibrionales bacterium CG12_big_fil_rev_8_21_14_0_65_38_15]|nr:MAG: hypothetical protein COW79_01395 [Bdellovibrionales bacterium CG22_combo_CG10-13_8_21_14_all_38_13]PIQ54026.1 MAG: hypothetical protein COW01_11845 [Bdellovibrionales bacterium CG12_big_fil_rev_8_21_14_0_65_38_15]PIR28551.1 MAG: hypothetical protein COV38_14845 [Bdellovibrionales bacterium CG11_big_fil_rev_8_21_14_0_20_38_13]